MPVAVVPLTFSPLPKERKWWGAVPSPFASRRDALNARSSRHVPGARTFDAEYRHGYTAKEARRQEA
ncbi:MAG: hypothetical protein AMXMBFR7_23030 [Planctomycetota bacterium]